GRHAMPSGRVPGPPAGGVAGTARPNAGPTSPPAMMPTVRETARETTTAHAAPAIAATSSRRPLTSPTASPIIAAGKITSIPSRFGSTIASPIDTPANVAIFHGINVVTTAAYQSPNTATRPS